MIGEKEYYLKQIKIELVKTLVRGIYMRGRREAWKGWPDFSEIVRTNTKEIFRIFEDK